MNREASRPPRHLVDAAEHRFDLAATRKEAAALHRRKQIALEHDAPSPVAREFARHIHALAPGGLLSQSEWNRDMAGLFGGSAVLARGPAIEIGQRTQAERAFLGERFRGPPQPLAVGIRGGGARE